MNAQRSLIWVDGKLVPWEQATFHVLSHALHYGYGVFEGLRAYEAEGGRGSIFRLHDHIRRLFESAGTCRLEVPFSAEEMNHACLQTLKANGMSAGYIRPLVFLGEGSMGLGAFKNKIHAVVAAWEWGAYLGEEGVKNGIRARISSHLRSYPNPELARAKICGNYVTSTLAKKEAYEGDFQEAILLDEKGRVAEGSGENLFIVRDGLLITPSPSSPILLGITRDSILQIAKNSGTIVSEENISREDLYAADEVFLTGTAAEVTPVREIDHRPIGRGGRGPLTEKLQTLYRNACLGRDPQYQHWLTPIG